MWKGGRVATFVGIDHATTAIRVAIMGRDGKTPPVTYEIPRDGRKVDFMPTLKERVPFDDIEMLAIAYSMGDAIDAITPVAGLEDRGVRSLDGVGAFTGMGTRMFDDIRASGIPAMALPGLHDGCPWLDPRFTFLQSHVASPKKVAAAYHCFLEMSTGGPIKDAIVASVSSNTVSILVKGARVVGGIDAALGAPGLRHGPLDVEAIRRVDAGHMTANEAFSRGGALREPYSTPEDLLSAHSRGEEGARLTIDALVMAVAMEISGLATVAGGVDAVAVTGALGEVREPVDIGAEVARHIGRKVQVFSRFSAAIGAARMALSVADGASEVFGIPVKRS